MPPKKARAKIIRNKTSGRGVWEIALDNLERVANEWEAKTREDAKFMEGRRHEAELTKDKAYYEFDISALIDNPEFKEGKAGVPKKIALAGHVPYSPSAPITLRTARTPLVKWALGRAT